MKSLWNECEASRFNADDLALRGYTSRLLGRCEDLVLHGGGNTSVKVLEKNIFGDDEHILYVKGSGWDLKTIEAAGFSPCRLDYLKRLATLESMTDTQIAEQLKVSRTNPNAPSPSVEAILHALIPSKYVDHTHADAVVALSNTPHGEQRLRELYGERMLVLPYIMSGFVLARQVYEATQAIDWSSIDGIILMHHGVFTFHDDARQSYEKMIEIVDQAEQYLAEKGADKRATATHQPSDDDLLAVARMRKQVSDYAGKNMLAQWKLDLHSVGFSGLPNCGELVSRGPVTPDHALHTKRIAADLSAGITEGIDCFVKDYQAYFAEHNLGEPNLVEHGLVEHGLGKHGLGKHGLPDPAPRYAIWPDKGVMVFSQNAKRVGVVSDIVDHTLKAIQAAEAVESWQTLSAKAIFKLEYWDLEQAKLTSAESASSEFEGKVAVVTGAASGIGLACAETLLQAGACVLALDINTLVVERFDHAQALGVVCDVTDGDAINTALAAAIKRFGGIDIVVSNAGMFPSSARLEELSDETWQKSLDLNLTSHLKLIRSATPFLKLGLSPAIVIIASKNVPAPGPGAGAYSSAKAGLTQLARVAALELGADGVRVNVLHPNAVFDTGVWSEEVLAARAQHYGLTVEQYKCNNVLQSEVTSYDVADLTLQLAGKAFAKTTGAQIPIDGGNERVI